MFSSPQAEQAIAECEAFIKTRDDAWSIDRTSAMLLRHLALARGAKLIVEVGMSYGHSGLFLADAAKLNGGRFITMEMNEKKVPIAQGFFARAGLGGVATIIHGAAPATFSQVPAGIEMLFIDATKSEQDAYIDAIFPKLAPRAVIVTDNASSHPEEMKPFLARLRQDARLSSALVPIGNGMEVTVRVA